MFFSVKTTNLYWEIFTKNLVAFKRWDGLRMILWGFTEKSHFQGEGGSQNPIYIEIAQKGENLGKVADLREGLWKKRGGG